MTALLIAAQLLLGSAWAQETTEEAPAPEVPTVEEATAPLNAAYQKEYAYLAAEKTGLAKRLSAHKAEADKVKAAAEAEIRNLEARLTAMQIQTENTEVLLQDVERRATATVEGDDALDSAFFQASGSLSDAGIELPEAADETLTARAEAFAPVWSEAAKLIRRNASVVQAPGTWFDANGVQVKGTFIEVGQIGTFGVKDGVGHALIPSGNGDYQAWSQGGGASAEAIASGTATDSLGIYLHEGRKKRIEERPPKTLQDVLDAGGVVGYVIIGLGFLALAFMGLRALTLRAAGSDEELVNAAIDAFSKGADTTALQKRLEASKGSAARIVARVMSHTDMSRGSMEDLAQEALLAEMPRVERYGAAILVAAAVAPLLGLLGTVTGMIATFDIITEFGTGDPRMLSGGISAALVTTQLGLIVAIPALLGGNLLSGWGEGVVARAESSALRLINEAISRRNAGQEITAKQANA